MAETVEVVIKIPKKCKEFLDNGGKVDWLDAIPIIDAIANGTVLPEGHGRLISADETKNKIEKSWAERKGFSLVDVINVIDLETETYVRPDWGIRRNKCEKI